MTETIEFVLIIALAALVISLGRRVHKRQLLIRSMKRLDMIEGISVHRLVNPFLSLVKHQRTPEYIVDIYGNIYLVRCYNGFGAGRSVHFASGRFTSRYSKLKGYYYRAGMGRVVKTRGFAFGASVKIIEPITLPRSVTEKGYTEVLIFNPAPSEVSYVVKEKNSIRAAFTGDEVYGRRIFTAATFEIFADREARRIRLSAENKGDHYEKVY